VSDANAIRSYMDLARSTGSTFLAIMSPAAQDMAGNFAVERSGSVASPALQAASVAADSTATVMTGFSINMGLGVLKLTFAEPVIAASIRFGELMFSDAANGTTTSSPSRTAVTSAPFSTVVSVTLRDQDLDNLKRRSLCTTPAACYLSFGASTITDTSNLFVVAREPDNPVPVAQHVSDLFKPSITGSGFRLFELNTGQIVLSFNKAVRVSAIDVLELAL
jgi:hypothetical protein